MLRDKLMQAAHPKVAAPGQQAYTTPGSYTFTVPAGVTSICAVCVAGGQARDDIQSGGGGSLAYSNSIGVTPGWSITVQVGSGAYVSDALSDSSLVRSGTTFVRAPGFQSPSSAVGDVSNVGGTGYFGGGGGGAGGYSGIGGDGGTFAFGNPNGVSGQGGGGGGGAAGRTGFEDVPDAGDLIQNASGGGGGVGILGVGSSGAGGVLSSEFNTTVISPGGQGGSGGGSGDDAVTNLDEPYTMPGGAGGAYGGGRGVPGVADVGGVIYDSSSTPTNGAGGAVRIIWGAGRSYPSNAANV
jgi:hypothetical protein